MKAVAALLALTSLAACSGARERQLRAEISQVEARVAAAEVRIQASTAAIGAEDRSMAARVRYRPLSAWIDRVNARPPLERTITFRQTARQGRIAARSWDCGPLGDGGWYVEVESGDSTSVDILLQGMTLSPTQDGIRLSVPLRASVRTQVHGHIDPCLGGGAGWHPRVGFDESFAAVHRLRLLPPSGHRLPYELVLESPDQLAIGVDVDLGDIGKVRIPFTLTGLARDLLRGELDLLFEESGQAGPFPDGAMRTYQLRLTRPDVAMDAAGVRLAADVEVDLGSSRGATGSPGNSRE